ncbi:MAG TPA: SH3 domain-containing protein [Oscillatoriaceae cyanobacterium M7585_C2015_266]|nr:SH3 domain-containing protein [Oscillatoriaceae cyanobacterium M7585_C2015_266]
MALALLAAGGIAAALYLAAKHSSHPERPVFPEEQVVAKPTQPAKNPTATPKAAQTPSPTPTPTETPAAKKLEPGAFRARVTWPQGLLLRDRPSFDANTLGGVGFNETVIVLEETSDKEWQRVRLENSDLKGWVKGGNTERLSDE